MSIINRDNVNWEEMIIRNVFNVLVKTFIGLNWQIDLLDLCEEYEIVLGSQNRKELLEGLENKEEMKKSYHAREIKRRFKEKST